MQHGDFRFEIKSVSEADGSFTGLASTYGNVDLGGDEVMPGAFSKTLSDSKTKGPFPLLMGHDAKEQIGYAELQDSNAGLVVNGKLVMHSDKSKQAYALMKARALRGLSIGYDAVRSVMKGSVRQLTEVKLFEISLTPFPMNELALVTSVKDASDPVGQFCRVMSLYARQIRGE
jgi:HK97 family phage prohead protease